MVLALSPAFSAAGDDASPPLYVYHDGKLIPTVIIPPKDAERLAVQSAANAQPSANAQPRASAPPASSAVAGAPRPTETLQAEPVEPSGDSARVPGADRLFPSDAPTYASHPITFRRRPRTYVDNYYYPPYAGVPVVASPQALTDVYIAGRLDERYDEQRRFNERDMAERRERVLNAHEAALRRGQQLLFAGDYARARVALMLAADLDQGDPACRIHLAQAELALGNYTEAATVLRRALELQPKLLYVELHLEGYYRDPAELGRGVDRLAAHLARNAVSADIYFMLGFFQFQQNRLAEAHAAFRRVATVREDDALTRAGLRITRIGGG